MANWHERHHNKFVQCNLKEDGEENHEVIWIVITSGGYFNKHMQCHVFLIMTHSYRLDW